MLIALQKAVTSHLVAMRTGLGSIPRAELEVIKTALALTQKN